MHLKNVVFAFLFFCSGILSAQKISLQGQVIPADDPKQKPGKCTLVLSNGQTLETNKKGSFSLSFDKSDEGKLIEIKSISTGDGELKIVNARDIQYIMIGQNSSDDVLPVYVLSPAVWAQRKTAVQSSVDAHYNTVLRRMMTSLRGMDARQAQHLSEIIQSAYPQYKPILVSNLCSNVASVLSADGSRALSLMLEKNVAGAISALSAANASTLSGLADLRLLAQLQVVNFEFEAAALHYQLLLKKMPNDLSLLTEFKEMTIMASMSEQIMAPLQAALTTVKNDEFQGRNHNDLASIYNLRNDYAMAAAETNLALSYLYKLEQQYPEQYHMEVTAALFNLGNVYREMKTEDMRALAVMDSVLGRIRLRPEAASDRQLQSIGFFANNFAGEIAYRSQSAKVAYPYYDRMFTALRSNPSIRLGLPKDQLFSASLRYCDGKEAVGATQDEITSCLEESIKLLGNSFDLDKQSLGTAAVYVKIAEMQQAKGETDRALHYYQQALRALDITRNATTLGHAANLLNCTAALMGDYGRDEEAKIYFQDALEKAQMLEKQSLVEGQRRKGQIWFNIGQFHKKRMQTDSAFAAFSKALAEFSAIEKPEDTDKALTANTYNQTGALWSELKNDPARAEADFTKALDLYSALADVNPVKYTIDAAICANNLLSVRSDHLETADKKAALALIDNINKRLRTPGLNPDEVKEFQQNMETYRKIFSGQMGAFEQAVIALGPLQNQRKKIAGNTGKTSIQRQIVAKLEQALEASPVGNKKTTQTLLAQESGNLAWYAIFDRQYALAETAARRALILDPSQTWVNSNLAHALLLQGKWEDAKAIYLRLKDVKHTDGRFFKAIFLEDIEEMKKAGISHSQFEEIIRMLR